MRTNIFIAIVVIVILVISLMACSSANKAVEYPHITSAAFETSCQQPNEAYEIPPISFPIPAQVSRHSGCLGVDDMLVISWPGGLTPKNKAAADLLVFMYLEHNDDRYLSELLKLDVVQHRDFSIGSAFYKLTEITGKKTE